MIGRTGDKTGMVILNKPTGKPNWRNGSRNYRIAPLSLIVLTAWQQWD